MRTRPPPKKYVRVHLSLKDYANNKMLHSPVSDYYDINYALSFIDLMAFWGFPI